MKTTVSKKKTCQTIFCVSVKFSQVASSATIKSTEPNQIKPETSIELVRLTFAGKTAT